MSKGMGTIRRRRPAELLRKVTTQQFRDIFLKVGKIKLGDVNQMAHNRDSRRQTASFYRKRGRGYTTPRRGPAHTRGG